MNSDHIMITNTQFARLFVRGFQAFPNEAVYKAKVADAFYSLADYFSEKYESKGDDFVVTAQDDTLNLHTPKHDFLFNRQTPSRQIWVSSPLSGSLKFDYDNVADKWYDHKRPELEMKGVLSKEVESVVCKE